MKTKLKNHSKVVNTSQKFFIYSYLNVFLQIFTSFLLFLFSVLFLNCALLFKTTKKNFRFLSHSLNTSRYIYQTSNVPRWFERYFKTKFLTFGCTKVFSFYQFKLFPFADTYPSQSNFIMSSKFLIQHQFSSILSQSDLQNALFNFYEYFHNLCLWLHTISLPVAAVYTILL